MIKLAVAIDGGHSMFKVRAALTSAPHDRIAFEIPTIVIPAIRISDERTRIRAELETVDIDGRKYFFGETAIRQGRAETYTGQHGEWIDSVQHDVLVVGAWRKVMQSVGSQPMRIHLVMGLPAKYFGSQNEALRNRVLALLTPRLLPGQTLKVMVQSQSDAPLQWLAIKRDGAPNDERNLDVESWGVIEIGHYTTDFALSERGSLVEFASVSCPGVHMVYDAMSPVLAAEKIPTAIDVVDKVVRNREITWYGKMRDMGDLVNTAASGFEAMVLDEADRLFGQQAGMLDGIVIGGGGAQLLSRQIKQRFPTAIVGDDPRSMVAEGFCRLGLMSLAD